VVALLRPVLWLRTLLIPAVGWIGPRAAAVPEPAPVTWTVDGFAREGLQVLPETPAVAGAPVVLVFHGHGGTARNAARSFALHRYWPEAIVVYPQGLNTPGRLTDPEGRRPGWQHAVGEQGDRDLKLVDEILARLRREQRIDERRIHATGHSNGGGFTYLLWAQRGAVFASFAPTAAGGAELPDARDRLEPRPVLHVAGRADALVSFAAQERTIARVREFNRAGPGEPWAPGCTYHPSPVGAPVVAFVHAGGHAFPAAAPPLIARFLREHPRTQLP
jgi:polyhydroxybutyrate depolymerase